MLAWDHWKHRADVFKAAQRGNLPWIYHLQRRYRALDDIKAEVNGLLKTHPGGLGFLAWDEPKLPEMRRAGRRVAWIKKTHPEMLVFATVNPIKPPFEFSFPNLADQKVIDTGLYDEPSVPYSYDDHLDNLATIVQSDVLMANIYPFWNPKRGYYPDRYMRDQYFFMLQALRKAGLKHNRPYWIFVQAYEDPGRCRLPSESDLRMEVYSALAFGFTGISYFLYDAGPGFHCMVDQNNAPTAMYHRVRALNAEVARLGRSLRFLTCTDVRYVPGSRQEGGKTVTNPVPRPLAAFHPKSRVAKDVRGVEFAGSGFWNDGLIGFFRDDQAGKYVMLVNLQHGKGRSAEAAKASFTVTLNPSVTSVHRLSRKTGRVDSLPIVDGKLRLDLPGGTGELLKLGDAKFPGLKDK